MRADFIVVAITTFLIYNTYYDGMYTKLFQVNKKYMLMTLYGFCGLSLYMFMKKNPGGSKSMFTHANNIIRYMPIDKGTTDMLTPIFNFASTQAVEPGDYVAPQMKRMMHSGGNSTKRSVSETKKKYVASQQNWCCDHCKEQLKATFEVDHKVDLQYGGSNHISNLVALCCECHKTKTMQSNL